MAIFRVQSIFSNPWWDSQLTLHKCLDESMCSAYVWQRQIKVKVIVEGLTLYDFLCVCSITLDIAVQFVVLTYLQTNIEVIIKVLTIAL